MQTIQPTHVTTRLKNDIEAAQLYGVKVSTIRKWRILGRGPRFVKIGSLVRYRDEDLIAFLDSCPTGGGHLQAA